MKNEYPKVSVTRFRIRHVLVVTELRMLVHRTPAVTFCSFPTDITILYACAHTEWANGLHIMKKAQYCDEQYGMKKFIISSFVSEVLSLPDTGHLGPVVLSSFGLFCSLPVYEHLFVANERSSLLSLSFMKAQYQ